MKRQIQGLSETVRPTADQVPDGVFLVRVEKAQYWWHPQKPFYLLRLCVLEPQVFGPHNFRPCVLHGQSTLEAGLVSTRLPL